MAGHSQFANIKHKKEAQDKKRAKLFTKFSRMIEVAARAGSPDPEMNPRLRVAVTMARKVNMSKDKIAQAISKGSGGISSASYDEIRYEFRHNSSGVCGIISVSTDNRNRSAGEVRSVLSKRDCTVLAPGGAMFMFENVGRLTYKVPEADASYAKSLTEKVFDLDVVDVTEGDGYVHVYIPAAEFDSVSKTLEPEFGESDLEESRLMWRARECIEISEEDGGRLFALIGALEELDDVQYVDVNCVL